MAPAAVITSVFLLGPLIVAALISVRPGEHFDVTQIVTGSYTLEHYRDVLGTLNLRPFLTTTVYVVINVVASVGVALWVSVLVNVPFRGRSIAQAVLLLPWAIPGVVVSISFLWILDQSFGVLNYLLQQVGLIEERIGWLTDSRYSLIGVLLPTILKTYPLAAITMIAAMKAIPKEHYEAAAVDGASRLQRFRFITLPGIRSATLLVVVVVALLSFNSFDFIYPLTQGGPIGSTETLAVLIYNEAFRYFYLERASALSIVAVAIAAVWIALGFRWLRREYF